ncbi:hypothetical protein [Streptomyces scabiei]|uniref:hypothetical protein n=2 Tax=Streptomyces TaxID=1883 RepID=UPI0029B5D465|nr:hypothetical protein [Streptomyces scabiei]MDX3113224.1 hypothetical protein [Streptomyces scabiei]
MSIRPWVVVDPPDRRGLRRVTINGNPVGSAWSLGELRKLLRRFGHPDDTDLENPSCVYWRGGDSKTWPDRRWHRYGVIAPMLLGLLASMALHAVIGWPDALGALTFAQRLVGVLFLLAAAVQAVAAPAVVDYWGRRQSRLSGALVLLAVLMTLATTSLLLFLWLQEREFISGLLAFVSLWVWSLWASWLLVNERVWRGIPHPRKFAAGVTATAVLTAVSLGYSILYQPVSAPVHFILNAQFGKPQTSPDLPFVQIPLTLYAKNDGAIPAYIVVDDFTVFGRSAKFSHAGEGLDEWSEDAPATERYTTKAKDTVVATGPFGGPGTTLSSGQELKVEKVITLPKDTKYKTLQATLRFVFLRQDRGKVDDDFTDPKSSWDKSEGKYYCPPGKCDGDYLIYHGRVRYNDNLINVTRKPRYVAAFWSPESEPLVRISSDDFFRKEKGTPYEEYSKLNPGTEEHRYGLNGAWVDSEVPVQELLKGATG